MFDIKGYFNQKGDEYTLTTPKTRAPYQTCLTNNVGYAFRLNQFGMGETVCKFKFTEKNTISLQRTIYFRDDETNDVWCVAGYPYLSTVEDFKCTHKPSCSVISSMHDGIQVSIRFFVPTAKRCDIQTITIENLSGRQRKISVFPVIQLQLKGFDAPSWSHSLGASYRTEYNEEIDGLYLEGRSPHTKGGPYDAFLSSTTPIHAYSADDRFIFGCENNLSAPYAILDGEDLDSKPVAIGKLLFAFQTKIELKDKESFTTDYILGICSNLEGAKSELYDLKSHEDIETAFAYTVEVNKERREKVMINTPHAETNAFVNYWLKMGHEFNILFRRAPRDNLQFANAAITYIPEATRYTILNVMKMQFNDGHFVRHWTPISTVEYGDKPAWIITTTCDYLKYTGDFAMLDENIDFFDFGNDTAWMHIVKALERLSADRGPHGLCLSHFADWNDALCTGVLDKNAESVFVSMQFANCLKEMAELCGQLNKTDLKKKYEDDYVEICRTINEHAWDPEGYYVRSFACGNVYGSSKCQKGSRIYVNPQSWSFISGVCPEERRQSVLSAIDKYIDTPVGCRVNYPPYSEYDPILGRISFQYPGTTENGAIYAHATSFKMYSDCILGLGDRAYSSFLKLLPSNPDNPMDIADAVPYTLSNACSTADICWGKSSATPWTTGTLAWLYRTVVEGLLGARFAYGGFKVDPAFPSTWDKASMTIRRNETDYVFNIVNNHTGIKKIYVNNKLIDGDFVAFSDKKIVNIRIEL